MPGTPSRKLSRAHFAFMRALTQGLDERTSWDRYLRVEGEHTDLRAVRKTVAWIRDAFAAAARREARPGTARLILLAPQQAAAGVAALSPATQQAPAPTLQAFAEAAGMEDFSEEEQIEAYLNAHPAAGQPEGRGAATARPEARMARRERLVARQLEALRWLEDLVAQDPRPDDRVEAWLHPALAQRLVHADLPTLARLVDRINALGARWWVRVPGIGNLKAARILDWLSAHEAALGFRVGAHARVARSAVTAEMLAAVVPARLGLVPLEKLTLPPHLDGHAGRQRADRADCTLAASNDLQAVDAWLAAKGRAPTTAGLSATQRAYRKEAERLLLWAVLERGAPLSSLADVDLVAYDAFLAAPPRHWCGPRHQQRWSTSWRPLEGPLSAQARRHALAILRSLYGFLVAHGYLASSPLVLAQAPATSPSHSTPTLMPPTTSHLPGTTLPLGTGRALTFAQWDHLRAALARRAIDEPGRRLQRAVQWLYATGLRLSELVQATCGDLAETALSPGHAGDLPSRSRCWTLRVRSRSGSQRDVPVPTALVEALDAELVRCGVVHGIAGEEGRAIRILMRVDPASGRCLPWSASAVYKRVKAFMADAARSLEGEDATQLMRATTHWLRHTHGTHALRGREGRAALSLQRVQNNLGHASVATTSAYLSGQDRFQETNDADDLRAFWGDL